MRRRIMQRVGSSGFFKLRIALCLVCCSAGLLLAMIALPSTAGVRPGAIEGKIAPQVLADTIGGNNASVVILLADQADVSAAYGIKDQDARGWFVYNTLTQHAARTQAGLRAFLDAQGISYQSFWAANMIVATAARPLVESLASRADVARIDSNNPTRWVEPPEVANFGRGASLTAPNTAEWGVLNVNAPSVWAMGFTGTGIVIDRKSVV